MKEAAEIRATKHDEYQKKLKSLTEKYNEAYRLELLSEVDYKERTITEDEYAEIVELIRMDGKIGFVRADGERVEIERVNLLAMVAANFVE